MLAKLSSRSKTKSMRCISIVKQVRMGLDNGDQLLSLILTSIYINLPFSEVINGPLRLLYPSDNVPEIERYILKLLFIFGIRNVHFNCNDKWNSQVGHFQWA